VRCLVTGATGLVGSHVVRALLRHDAAVRALVRQTSDRGAIAGLPLDVHVGDVLEPASLRRAVKGCDVVFHVAAHFAYWGKTSGELDNTALSGTANVLDAAARAGVRRVVVTSSSVVLGYSEDGTVLDEASSAQEEPDAPYVSSKIRQDVLALERARQLDVEVVLVCPTLVVGAFATTLGPSNGMICTYLRDPLRFTYPGGCNVVAASDVGHGHVLAAARGQSGSRYVLGGENLDWRDLHTLISELCCTYGPSVTASHTACLAAAVAEELRSQLTGRPPMTTRQQAAMVGRYYWYSHARVASLGYRPVPAREALAIALAWLLASPHVPRETRTRLRLSGEVWAARAATGWSEAAIRKPS
jgi:dihydroflavonol-4-reductase